METGLVQRLYPNYDYWSPFRMWFWHQVLFFLGILLVVAVLFMRIETPITCSKPHLYFFGIETQSLINMQIYWTPSWITVTPIFLYFASHFHQFFVSEPQISKCSAVLVGESSFLYPSFFLPPFSGQLKLLKPRVTSVTSTSDSKKPLPGRSTLMFPVFVVFLALKRFRRWRRVVVRKRLGLPPVTAATETISKYTQVEAGATSSSDAFPNSLHKVASIIYIYICIIYLCMYLSMYLYS